MFNAPRRTNVTSLASSAIFSSSNSGGSGGFDPLAQSTPNLGSNAFGDVDPWSTAPSPVRASTPRRESSEPESLPVTNGTPVIGGVTAEEGLNQFINDPPALYTSLLDQLDPASSGSVSLASVQRLLTSSKLPAATVEKIINLTAREQSSLSRQEFFCALALISYAQSTDTEDLSIEKLSASVSDLPLPQLHPTAPPAAKSYAATPGTEVASSPWDTAPRPNGHYFEPTGHSATGSSGAPDVDAERGYWKKLETVNVTLVPEKEGWFLTKYRVETDKRGGPIVSRRYSDFVWLLDCLLKRYPFRLLPNLPPKRLGPDASFLEARRKGLRRFINMIVNHPVTRDDGAVNVFLTEPNFEAWRKRTKVSTDEESASKQLNPAQEMGIPADLDEKLGILRDHLPSMLASYQKLVILAERSLARLQAASADASRIALSLHTIAEEMPGCCYRCVPGGQSCSLCVGVGRGLGEIGESWTRVAEEGEKRATTILLGSTEALKTQRDLYVAFRDLFLRHDRLSKDTVDALRKKVEGRQKKMETMRSAAKPGWESEVDKLISANDLDSSTVNTLLSRRVFIRACMWHELAVVFHSRQAAQATLGWRSFAQDQVDGAKAIADIWAGLTERLGSMPLD